MEDNGTKILLKLIRVRPGSPGAAARPLQSGQAEDGCKPPRRNPRKPQGIVYISGRIAPPKPPIRGSLLTLSMGSGSVRLAGKHRQAGPRKVVEHGGGLGLFGGGGVVGRREPPGPNATPVGARYRESARAPRRRSIARRRRARGRVSVSVLVRACPHPRLEEQLPTPRASARGAIECNPVKNQLQDTRFLWLCVFWQGR
jgi:hypothetical protein